MSIRVIGALLCLTLATPARADEWWGRDKALHLSVSLGLGSGTYGGLWRLGDDRPAVRLALAWSLAMQRLSGATPGPPTVPRCRRQTRSYLTSLPFGRAMLTIRKTS